MDYLSIQKLKILVTDESSIYKISTECDLFTIVTGPKDHDLFLIYDDKIIGKVSFTVIMEEEEDVCIQFPTLNVSFQQPTECYFIYSISNR